MDVPGPPRDEVARRLRDACGHAPDELVTWFSTINGFTEPAARRLPPGSELLCRWYPRSLDGALDHSARQAEGLEPWHPWYIQIMKMDPDSLYVDVASDPVAAPVYRWNPDDDMHLLGFRLADSLEDLVGMWLELFDHGLHYDHDRHRWPTTDAIADVSVETLRSTWTGSEFLARLGLEQAAADTDPAPASGAAVRRDLERPAIESVGPSVESRHRIDAQVLAASGRGSVRSCTGMWTRSSRPCGT